LLIFDNFEIVYLFSNPNISAKTVLKYTWHIPKFKLDIIELNASCLSVIALLIFILNQRGVLYLGHPVYPPVRISRSAANNTCLLTTTRDSTESINPSSN
jgi:hypothetical protein